MTQTQEPSCVAEEKNLLNCYSENASDRLKCASFVNEYSMCAAGGLA